MTHEQIAEVAHEVNRAYCEAIGDPSQEPWEEADQWQKDSAINGVAFVKENPRVTARCTHANWSKEKYNDGWAYGPTKDAELKTHPCLMDYEDLPTAQRAKDSIFKTIVNQLLELDESRGRFMGEM